MLNVKKFLDILNRIAPFDLAEEWDNSGLQAGHPNWDVKKIMIGLDVTMPLLAAAKKSKSNLVLTHHPLMMTPEKSFDFSKMPGSAIQMAAKEKISIVSAHTNLDKANQGLNEYFSMKIGLKKIMPFLPADMEDQKRSCTEGIGRLGLLDKPISLHAFAGQIKEKLGLLNLRVIGDMTSSVQQIAVCTGSGGSLVNEFIRSKADVFVTGDIKYHEARTVEEFSKTMIDVGHFGSEHMAIELLSDKLNQAFKTAGLNIEILEFLTEKDPFTIV